MTAAAKTRMCAAARSLSKQRVRLWLRLLRATPAIIGVGGELTWRAFGEV